MNNPILELVIGSGKTVVDVCRESGVSRQTVHALLNGEQEKPHLVTVSRLAKYFETDAVALYENYLKYQQEQDTLQEK